MYKVEVFFSLYAINVARLCTHALLIVYSFCTFVSKIYSHFLTFYIGVTTFICISWFILCSSFYHFYLIFQMFDLLGDILYKIPKDFNSSWIFWLAGVLRRTFGAKSTYCDQCLYFARTLVPCWQVSDNPAGQVHKSLRTSGQQLFPTWIFPEKVCKFWHLT